MALTLTEEDIEIISKLIDNKLNIVAPVKEVKELTLANVYNLIKGMEEKFNTKFDTIEEQNRKTNLSLDDMTKEFNQKFDDLEEQNRKTKLSMDTMKYAVANNANTINPSYPGIEQTMVMAGRSPGQKTNSYYMQQS